jgi:hypothetical protein
MHLTCSRRLGSSEDAIVVSYSAHKQSIVMISMKKGTMAM